MLSLIFVRANFLLPEKELPENRIKPRIIFPYYPHMKNELELFQNFEIKTKNNETFTTLSVDCLQHRTYCAKFNLQPGKLSVSIIDHENPKQINQPISQETIAEAVTLVTNHGYLKIKTIDEVRKIASKVPLFLLVTRPNAGDLEEKKPIFAQVARSNIGKPLAFGYVTDKVLYEEYAHYPYIAFVYVSPSGNHLSFRGEFTVDNIQTFVDLHTQPFLSAPVLGKDILVTTIVGNDDFYNKAQEEFSVLDAKLQVAYVNSTSSLQTAEVLCHGKYQCVAVANYKTYKAVSCGNDISNSIDECVSKFAEKWSSYPLAERIKTRFMLSYYFNPVSYTIIACCTSFVIAFGFLIMLDSSRIIKYI